MVEETLHVDQAGYATVQDLGRVGYERIGIAVNGAADQWAATVANALVGNAPRTPHLEITASDFAFTTTAPLLVSVTGAPLSVEVDGYPRRMWEPLVLQPRQHVRLSGMHHGLRSYVAVSGGIHAAPVLGSCAIDTVLGIGAPVRQGDNLLLERPIGTVDHPQFRHAFFRFAVEVPAYGVDWTVPITPGPDLDAVEGGQAALAEAVHEVSPVSNHIGLRLDGPVPTRVRFGEVLSRGVPVGAIEMPPGAGLLALLRGRHVTAGYLVLAVATHDGRRALGQCAPGHRVRWRWTAVEEAVQEHVRRQERLLALQHSVFTAFSELGLPAYDPRPEGQSHDNVA